jgi:hypothetical protein
MEYIELAIGDPVVPPLASGLLARRLGFLELINAAMVSDEQGMQEGLDLTHLDRLLNGYLGAAGGLSPGALARGQIDSAAVGDVVAGYITCAADWDTRTVLEIERDIQRMESQVPAERETNPILWLVEPPGPEFLIRLETSARRRAVRLLAFAIDYHRERGRWPDALADAVPPESSANLTDPITGRPFGLEIRSDAPHIIPPVAEAVEGPDAKAQGQRMVRRASVETIPSNAPQEQAASAPQTRK